MSTQFTFRPDTLDFAIFCMVYFNNEYQLPTRFEPSDILIDVGAHIGSFAFASLVRGAGKIICAEAHPENAQLARQHLAEYITLGQVELHHVAVWRSDKQENLRISDFPLHDNTLINTGGASIQPAQNQNAIHTISLDDLIGAQQIHLLKLDCEGSEFPILLTSRKLAQVAEMVGEYHEHDHYTITDLIEHLQSQGFTTEHKQHQQYLDGEWLPLPRGYFRAIRRVE